MESFGAVLFGILEFFVRALYGIIRLFIWIIGFFLSGTWLANHFDGIRRFGWWIAVVTSAYLLFGIVRATVPVFWTPSLTPVYQWQIVIGAIVLLLVGIALRELDVSNYTSGKTPDLPVKTGTGPIQTPATVHSAGIVAAIVLIALVVGILSAISSERHESTLAEKLCAQADARISDGIEQRVRDGAGFLDRVLGTRTAENIPCADD